MVLPPSYEAPSEILPGYSPALQYYDVIQWKKELQTPFQPDADRRWQLAIVEINSTQLNIYKFDNCKSIKSQVSRLFEVYDCPLSLTSNDLIQHLTQHSNITSIPYHIIKPFIGERFKSYTLQTARFGSAIDYGKKLFTLRLRLEINQFLLNFLTLRKFVAFYNALKISSEVALPIEDRFESAKYKTVPSELSRFRVENLQEFYSSLDKLNDKDLAKFRRNAIDTVYKEKRRSSVSTQSTVMSSIMSSSTESVFSSSSSCFSTSVDVKLPMRETDPFIDDCLIYAITCIKKLDATKSWKGKLVVSGDFTSEKLERLKATKNGERDKLFVRAGDFKTFQKLIHHKHDTCKQFTIQEFSVAEDCLIQVNQFTTLFI